MKSLKRVGSSGPHSIQKQRHILLLLGMREGLFLLKLLHQIGISVEQGRRGIVCLLAGLASPLYLHNGPCETRPRGVIGLVLAQDVQRRLQGV